VKGKLKIEKSEGCYIGRGSRGRGVIREEGKRGVVRK
jgi:hypothetical protein